MKVGDELTGEIGKGLLVLLGVGQDDSQADADYLAEKIAGLRIFEDEAGKMNLSVMDAGGAVLAVSQFTLFGDIRRGSGPRSMRRRVPSGPESFTIISCSGFAAWDCAAKPDVSRQ